MKNFLLIFIMFIIFSSQSFNLPVARCSGNLYPPSSWVVKSEWEGVAPELISIIFKELNISNNWSIIGPWARIQDMAENGEIDIVVTVYKNPQRMQYLQFLEPPFMDDPNVVWVKKGSSFDYSKWNDLIGRKGGAVIGDSYGDSFDSFIQKNLSIERVATAEQNFRKLAAGRIDYIPYGYYTGLFSAQIAGCSEEVVPLATPLLKAQMYIAVSKKSQYIQIVPELERSLKKLIDDGTAKKLLNNSLIQYQKQIIDNK